jgi:hypothetical protein
MNLKCFIDHEFGEMQFDSEGNPYKVCERCGKIQKYKPKTLADMDNMSIGDIDKLNNENQESYQFSNIVENTKSIVQQTLICKKCGGELHVVIPEIIMKNLTLYECCNCNERCYL